MSDQCAETSKKMRPIQLFASQCSEGVIIFDLGFKILWANKAALEMHEVTEVTELGRTIDTYHAKFQVRYVALLADTTDSTTAPDLGEGIGPQQDLLIEVGPLRGSSAPRLHRLRKMVLPDEAGQPKCVVHFLQIEASPAGHDCQGYGAAAAKLPALRNVHSDTSMDTINSESLCDALADARALAALCPAASHVLDEDMRILEVNQRWLEWLGFTREAVIGRKISDYMPVAAAAEYERQIRNQVAGTGQASDVTSEFLTSSGNTAPAIIGSQIRPVGAAQQNLVFSICVDAAAQKRSEEAVVAVFATSTVQMVIRKCDDTRIIDANRAFLKTTEFAASDIVGQRFDEIAVFETRSQRERFEAAIRGTGQLEPIEVGLKTARGDVLDCLLTATRIWVFGQACLLVILQDVTERRRTETELMSAIDAVMKDSSWFSRSVVERLASLRAPPKSQHQAEGVGDLTPRERDVLGLISLGLRDADIADRLGLTRSTIRNHLSTLYSKIGVHNRGSAIIWARERCFNITQLPARAKPSKPKIGGGGPGSKQVIKLNLPVNWAQDAKSARAE